MAYNTTPFHGKLSRVEKNNVNVDYTIDISFNTAVDMADSSRQGQQWKEGIPGMGSWSGNMNMYFVAGNTEQKALMDNIIAATPGTKLTDVKIMLDISTNGFSGDIYITSFAMTAPMGDVVKCSFGFVGNGAPTLSNAQ